MDSAIRPARPGDIPRMTDLLGELFRLEGDLSTDGEKQVRGLSALVADPSGRSGVFVAEVAGVVVGMATVQTLISTAEGGRVGLVEDVIVDRGHRGKGLGTRLLAEVEDWGRGRGLLRLQLLADKENLSAVEFYVKRRWTGTRLIGLRKML
jgi:GNAT superfamily N-acetyltransferase